VTEANKEKDTVSADQKATEAVAAAETTAPAAADDLALEDMLCKLPYHRAYSASCCAHKDGVLLFRAQHINQACVGSSTRHSQNTNAQADVVLSDEVREFPNQGGP